MYFYHRGLPLKVAYLDCESGQLIEKILGAENELQVTVPANCYMVHTVEEDKNNECDFCLYSIAVAPGWELKDDLLAEKQTLMAHFPQHKIFIEKFAV